MTERYLATIIQYLIQIVDKVSSQNSTISNKLDNLISAVQNIKISAESVNLNTDELEAKLDELKISTNGIKTSIDSIKTSTDAAFDSIIGTSEFSNPKHIGIVVAGSTEFEQNVVLCNITEGDVVIDVISADNTEAVQVTLVPGWNPIIIKSVINASSNTLLYGW